MTEIEREAKGYHILACSRVRGLGSAYSHHPDRCLWDICGKPSIQWVLEAVKGAKYIDKIAVLSESKKILETVESIGGVTAIERPLHTSHDVPRDYTKGTFKRNKPRSVRSEEPKVYGRAVDYGEYYLKETEGYEKDIIFEFGCNAPLITSEMLNRMIEKFFMDKGASYISALYRIESGALQTTNPMTGRPLLMFSQAGLPKQLAPPVWAPAPCSVEGLASQRIDGLCHNYIEITAEEGFDMHNEEDLFLARCYMKRRLLTENKEVEWNIEPKSKIEEQKEEKGE